MALERLFTAWKKEDQDQQAIYLLLKIIYLLVGICLLCLIGWMRSPSHMTVYIPPDISNGATLKANEIPSPLIYAFAYEVWQEINYWPQEGTQDYQNNIHAYWSYLSPSFKSDLLQDYSDLKTSGQVQRQRYLQGTNGEAYQVTNVKKLGANLWEVDLKMRLTEYKNNQAVKDIEVLYPLKVMRMAISQDKNPYGLVLVGFVSDPVRLKTYI